MQQIPQNIIDKAQKALNLKEGAEAVGNVNEAVAAAKILHDILLKWNLDLETVQASKIAQKANIQEVKFETVTDKRETDWVNKLYRGIAMNSMCKVWNYGDHVRIIGHAQNVSFVAYACEQLVSKIRISEKMSFNSYTGSEKRGTYRRGFFNGAVAGIWEQLQRSMREAHQKENPYAVMVVHKEQEINEWMIEQGYMSRLKTQEEIQKESDEHAAWWNSLTEKERNKISKDSAREMKKWEKKQANRKGPRGLTSSDGLFAGVEAGRSMSINRGMDDSSKPKGHVN